MPPTKAPARANARGSAAKAAPPPKSRFSRVFSSATQKAGAQRRAGGLGELFRDVRAELKKVEWPNRDQLTKLTAAVVGLSAIVGVFLGGVDFAFQEFFKLLVEAFGGGV